MMDLLKFLTPWEFSPIIALTSIVVGASYLYGCRLQRTDHFSPKPYAQIFFWAGLALSYLVMHSQFEYYAQHMFWVHRLQHLVLHHLGPFLIILARPFLTIRLGFIGFMRRLGTALGMLELCSSIGSLAARAAPFFSLLYRAIQNPVVAPALFIGLIFFWLQPFIHFYAMISARLYAVMNWSMFIDGLLFWSWALDVHRPGVGQSAGYGLRIILLWFIMLPQIVLGAYISLSHYEIYSVYEVCGRAWPISPLVDQRYGGLITWIPSSMMSVVGALVVLKFWLKSDSGIKLVIAQESSAQA